MIKKTKIFSVFITLILLCSCGGFSDAGKVLRNEKVTNTDEFLVQKRQPLSLPPDYKSIPIPKQEQKENQNNTSGIGKILKIPNDVNNSNKKFKSVEQSILNKINK